MCGQRRLEQQQCQVFNSFWSQSSFSSVLANRFPCFTKFNRIPNWIPHIMLVRKISYKNYVLIWLLWPILQTILNLRLQNHNGKKFCLVANSDRGLKDWRLLLLNCYLPTTGKQKCFHQKFGICGRCKKWLMLELVRLEFSLNLALTIQVPKLF